jgi:hypothetical protein
VLAADRRQDGLRRVLDDGEVVTLRDHHDGRHVGRVSAEMHGQNRFRSRRDGRFDLVGIDRVLSVVIDEHRPAARHDDGADARHERVRSGDDFVARADAGRAERQDERIGAGSHADGVRQAGQGGESLFEFLDRPAQREVAGLHDAAHILQIRLKIGKLPIEIRIGHIHEDVLE